MKLMGLRRLDRIRDKVQRSEPLDADDLSWLLADVELLRAERTDRLMRADGRAHDVPGHQVVLQDRVARLEQDLAAAHEDRVLCGRCGRDVRDEEQDEEEQQHHHQQKEQP